MENYSGYSSSASGPISGIFLIFGLAIWILMIVGFWKIFEKAGKPGWAAIIPIYNIIVLLEIIGKPVWWIILLFIPCVNIVFAVWMYNLLSKSFGQSEGFTIGLLLLPFVFFPLLGFGNYPYLGPAGASMVNRFNDSDYRDPFNTNTPPPQV